MALCGIDDKGERMCRSSRDLQHAANKIEQGPESCAQPFKHKLPAGSSAGIDARAVYRWARAQPWQLYSTCITAEETLPVTQSDRRTQVHAGCGRSQSTLHRKACPCVSSPPRLPRCDFTRGKHAQNANTLACNCSLNLAVYELCYSRGYQSKAHYSQL